MWDGVLGASAPMSRDRQRSQSVHESVVNVARRETKQGSAGWYKCYSAGSRATNVERRSGSTLIVTGMFDGWDDRGIRLEG